MLFGREPKENIDDLFGRKKEVKELESALKLKERLNVVYGVRRMGKTSLIKAVLNEKELPYVFVDVREIYLKYNSVPVEALRSLIAKEFTKLMDNVGIKQEEHRIDGNLDVEDQDLTSLLKSINEWCSNRKLSFVLAFDEAQYLRFSGSVKYDMLFAWSVDNLSNMIYILSGSEIGMLKDFLNYADIKAPLYGRFRNDIYLNRFSTAQSSEFLKSGFHELDKKTSKEEIKDTVGNLDGTVGWLSYYGYYRCIKELNHKMALDKVFEEGYALVKDEIEKLIKYSHKRYLLILKAIVNGQCKWSDIKPYVVAKSGTDIKDSLLNELLQNLVKFRIVEKDELRKEYRIDDPLVTYAIKHMK